jgi:hypothetical protein
MLAQSLCEDFIRSLLFWIGATCVRHTIFKQYDFPLVKRNIQLKLVSLLLYLRKIA